MEYFESISNNSSDNQDSGQQMFANLMPIFEEKPSKKKINDLNWLKKQEKDLQKVKKKHQARTIPHSRQSSRSRSRQKNIKTYSNDIVEANSIGAIVISDDSNQINEKQRRLRKLQDHIYDPIETFYKEEAAPGWKQLRKLDRLFERGLRYFRQGKPRDQLSFQIFNTIEQYFK